MPQQETDHRPYEMAKRREYVLFSHLACYPNYLYVCKLHTYIEHVNTFQCRPCPRPGVPAIVSSEGRLDSGAETAWDADQARCFRSL
jgi:hypothetical protein